MDSNVNHMCIAKINDYPDVLDVAQACCLLSICDKTLYKLIREGTLPAIKVGRKYRVAKCHIAQLLGMTEDPA